MDREVVEQIKKVKGKKDKKKKQKKHYQCWFQLKNWLKEIL
jgi:hypothetical protein